MYIKYLNEIAQNIFDKKWNTCIILCSMQNYSFVIFAKKNQADHWQPCYIGQTGNLSDRLGNHEKEAYAKKNRATHIHVHNNGNGESERKAEERDLILKWQPPCNDQYVD